MTNIGLFITGYNNLDITALKKVLAIKNSDIHFDIAPKIQTMGNPDLYNFAYSDTAFLSLIEQYRDRYDVCVIITAVPIENNYFTRTDGLNTIIATSCQTDELLEKSGRTLAEYYALAICQELVSFAFQKASGKHWSELFHQDTRGCLFDFAGHRPHKIAKLTNCDICPQSLGLLAEVNADTVVVDYVKKILHRIRRPSFSKSIKKSIMSPLLGFVYGGIVVGFVINVFSSLVLNNTPLSQQQVRFIWLLGACVPFFPLSVYAWSWLKYLQQRLKKVNA